MKTSDFNFELPQELIAQTPIPRRDASRLLVLDKGQTLLGVVWLEELIGKREADPIAYPMITSSWRGKLP